MGNSNQQQIEIENLYKELKVMNEKFLLKEPHSPLWKQKFDNLCDYAKDIAAEKWFKKGFNEKLKKLKEMNLSNEPKLNYETLVLKILRDFREGKGSGEEKITFYGFFMYKLMARVSVYKQEVEGTLYRGFKLSSRDSAKIRRMISFLKKNELYTKSHKPDLYNEKNKKLFIQNGICRDMKEVNRLLVLNNRKFNAETRKGNSIENSVSVEDNFISRLDDEDFISNFLDFVDYGYKKQISKRRQQKDSQEKKETFLKDIITCYYMNVLLKKSSLLNESALSPLFQKHSFSSPSILAIYRQHSQAVEARIKKEKVITPELKNFIDSVPVTLESISLSYGKADNYGSRRIAAFKKLLKELDKNNYYNILIDIRND